MSLRNRPLPRNPPEVRRARTLFEEIVGSIPRPAKKISSDRINPVLARIMTLYSMMKESQDISDSIYTLVKEAGVNSKQRKGSLEPTRLVKALFTEANRNISVSSINRYSNAILNGFLRGLSEEEFLKEVDGKSRDELREERIRREDRWRRPTLPRRRKSSE